MNEEYFDNLNKLMKERLEKYKDLQEENLENYGEKYEISHKTNEIKNNFEELEDTETEINIAGRLMAKRTHGKASFADIMDMNGRIQLYISVDDVGEESYDFFQDLDIGDILGLTGHVFKTRRGEITVRVSDFNLITKSLRPLPEKFHGLKDKDLRYRQRYLDLIVNPEVKETFLMRSEIISSIRNYLEERDFLEVETPMMHPVPGGATARPFVTHHNTLDMDLYLRIAPELYLKRLIVGGFEKIFEINRNFRNEGMSYKHNPEFTMMELYKAYSNYEDMMEITEDLVSNAAEEVLDTTKITYEDTEIDLSAPWDKVTMTDAVKEHTGFDYYSFEDTASARKAAEKLGIQIDDEASKGEILNELFEEKVEEKLIQPTFILDYPVDVSPLAKNKEEDSEFTYRFEAFIYGREIANAFSELNDPVEQKKRFEKQLKETEDKDKMMDNDFIKALEYGMPPTGGLGIGLDRLIMLFTDSSSIRDVILFPTLRSKD